MGNSISQNGPKDQVHSVSLDDLQFSRVLPRAAFPQLDPIWAHRTTVTGMRFSVAPFPYCLRHRVGDWIIATRIPLSYEKLSVIPAAWLPLLFDTASLATGETS